MDLYCKYSRAGRQTKPTELEFGTSQTTTTLITAIDSSHTIYLQRIIISITTDAAQTLTIQDTAGTPFVACSIPASPGVSRWDFDFGPKGVPITTGKNLQAVFSAAGLGGHIEWRAYQTPLTTQTAYPSSVY